MGSIWVCEAEGEPSHNDEEKKKKEILATC